MLSHQGAGICAYALLLLHHHHPITTGECAELMRVCGCMDPLLAAMV